MTDHTPDSLRKALDTWRDGGQAHDLWKAGHTHADAWEADIDAKNKLIIGVNAVVADNAALREKLEKYRKAISNLHGKVEEDE